jgi:hypothetical protein
MTMTMPPGAENMKVVVLSPAGGTKVTGNSVTLEVATSGYQLSADLAGKPAVDATSGHYHVLVDKSLVNMYTTREARVSLLGLKPGPHTVTVVPALNNHAEVDANAVSLTVDYEPAEAPPTVTDVTFPVPPTLKIISPKPGETVSGPFDVVVEVANFNLSTDLMGRPSALGYGHWHLNLDTTSGPMMGMGTMLGMSGEKVFRASTAGLRAGETHTLIALLTDNGHAPLQPMIADQVEVRIG